MHFFDCCKNKVLKLNSKCNTAQDTKGVFLLLAQVGGLQHLEDILSLLMTYLSRRKLLFIFLISFNFELDY